ncbi:signal peptidase I [Streptomyces sp. NPDC002120]|uniref:signal peptidase I n=1 Tax=Streptomyces sp. NPDC002120 TaxID=3364631 RepID=UPI0036887FB1
MGRQDGEAVAEGKERRIRNGLSGILWWLAAIAMVVCVGGSFWAYCAEEYRYVPILTGSMEPGIAKGTLVITEPVPTREMAAGQVIVLMPPEPWTPGDGLPTVHRIAEITHDLGGAVHMTTKGDANDSADPWRIDLTDGAGAYARVVYQVPHLGGWIVLVKSLGLVAGISLAAGTVLLYTAKWALRFRRRPAGGAAVPPAAADS